MTLVWNRTPIAGGEVAVAEAKVADGTVVFCRYYQHQPVAVVCTSQSATLNGGLVMDPKYAQKLLDEAMSQ